MNLGEAGGVPADVQWPGFVAGSGSVAPSFNCRL